MPDLNKIKIIKSSKPYKIWDILILIFFIALTAVILVFSYKEKGNFVKISYDNHESYYKLSIDKHIDILSAEGDRLLTVIIENGNVYVTDANCPDKVCQHTGKISRVRQTIICSPQGIVITITGDSENSIIPIG